MDVRIPISNHSKIESKSIQVNNSNTISIVNIDRSNIDIDLIYDICINDPSNSIESVSYHLGGVLIPFAFQKQDHKWIGIFTPEKPLCEFAMRCYPDGLIIQSSYYPIHVTWTSAKLNDQYQLLYNCFAIDYPKYEIRYSCGVCGISLYHDYPEVEEDTAT
jgi:hypothetical protein